MRIRNAEFGMRRQDAAAGLLTAALRQMGKGTGYGGEAAYRADMRLWEHAIG